MGRAVKAGKHGCVCYACPAEQSGKRFEPPDRAKGMTFAVIPFCRIVKFSGITHFLYQFWKILTKYCGRKEKDHNILWSKWYSRRESNPQRPLRRGLLYPFNYGSVLNFIARGRNHCQKKFYTKIYTSFFPPRENKHKSSGFARKTCVLGNILWIEQYLSRGLLYPFN